MQTAGFFSEQIRSRRSHRRPRVRLPGQKLLQWLPEQPEQLHRPELELQPGHQWQELPVPERLKCQPGQWSEPELELRQPERLVPVPVRFSGWHR